MAYGLAVIGVETGSTTSAAYRDYLARERVAWAPIVKESGFSLEE